MFSVFGLAALVFVELLLRDVEEEVAWLHVQLFQGVGFLGS